METEKSSHTPAERAKVNERLVEEVRRLLKPLPLQVIGHIDGDALCCRNGTVALVKIEDTVEAK